MGTLGMLGTSKGGQNRPKMDPKTQTMEENEKNEPNSQIRSVLWLITEEIHKIRGTTSYAEPLDTLEPQEGPTKPPPKKAPSWLREDIHCKN